MAGLGAAGNQSSDGQFTAEEGIEVTGEAIVSTAAGMATTGLLAVVGVTGAPAVATGIVAGVVLGPYGAQMGSSFYNAQGVGPLYSQIQLDGWELSPNTIPGGFQEWRGHWGYTNEGLADKPKLWSIR
ncbi:hypothetical protein [uncultured Pelagimonas sp.]|uniref:hypothetical protein n=1 Tax=uncultured Pelagimonas sp. TaxID=1618102 RepID=UPI002607D6B5|nr:hypothetical protein [uncultured Pelagimonas sp.]